MIRRPPRSTRTDTLCPYTTLFRCVMTAARPASGTTRRYSTTGSRHPDRLRPGCDAWRPLRRGTGTPTLQTTRSILAFAVRPARRDGRLLFCHATTEASFRQLCWLVEHAAHEIFSLLSLPRILFRTGTHCLF